MNTEVSSNSTARIAVTLCLVLVGSLLLSVNEVAGREESPIWKQAAGKRRAQTMSAAVNPVVNYAAHTRGLIQLAIANNGTFGTYGQDIADPFTGLRIPSCTYPKNSDIVYLWVGALWMGAVVGRDTLVSTATEDFYQNTEFWPDVEPFGDIEIKSIDVNSRFYSDDAYSEEDIICEYTDTMTDPGLVQLDRIDSRPHKPLGVKVTQRTMAWSYAYADDFILFDYNIRNIGTERLNQVYLGIWVDGDVWHVSRNSPEGWNDDIVGFFQSHPAPEGCGFIDTVNIAYTADNDGDPYDGDWDYRSARNVVGARVVRTPSDTLKYSFNWWIINYSDATRDFGPRRRDTEGDPFRSFGSRLGTPEGDRNIYYMLQHEEFDYDLLYTAIDHSNSGWLPPPADAETYARGYDARYLLSFGPFDVDPGQSLPISLAWVGGTDFHQDPNSFANRFDPNNPDPFVESLNFSDFALNARWASWVYDNPGVDTDGNGYAGEFRVCRQDSVISDIDTTYYGGETLIDTSYRLTAADTSWHKGDNVPDFLGAGPPPAPMMRVIPTLGKLIIRWNGFYSETTKDVFIGKVDFEGYRVYAGLDDRAGSMTLLSSYDREDYSRFVWKRLRSGELRWQQDDIPFSIDQLRELYADDAFQPLQFTRQSPLRYNDSLFYFERQDYNVSDLTSINGIHKVYPDARPPVADSTLWSDDDVVYDYGRPLPKYYEYEYIYDGILPSVPYYVSVTAFDFGSPGTGLLALETNPLNNLIVEYPQVSADTVERYQLDAYVYPNPYRVDADYAGLGFENRDRSQYKERARLLHFSNLPRVCTISIYSLDGDLIRRWDHDYPEGGPESMHDTWDLITRNTQSVVSGLYYWVIEDPSGRTQIGKFVIIK